MFTFLELENYRGFEHYRLNDLRRVNLLVGKNNCGKTSVLEAVQLLATGDARVLGRISYQRGELEHANTEQSSGPEVTRGYAQLSHFFHKRAFEQGSKMQLSGDGGALLISLEVGSDFAIEDPDLTTTTTTPPPRIVSRIDFLPDDGAMKVALKFVAKKGRGKGKPQLLPVSEDGIWLDRNSYQRGLQQRRTANNEDVILFITTESATLLDVGGMWDKVAIAGQEDEVIKAMQILEPELSKIVVLSGGKDSPFSQGTVIVSMKGVQERTPLGSHGEGMRRLLVLVLALVQARNGILLIDEIDTGLHYSVMGDLWKLVVSTAISSNVQVFATTHSLDCINGLATMCEQEPNLADEVSVQKLDRRLEQSVALHADEIQIADEQHIEMR